MDRIKEAVKVLHRDGLVVYPTDTIYGLGADALSDEAVAAVYEAKHRPLAKPVSIAVSDYDMLRALAVVTPVAETFIEQFLPGPFTVVLKAKKLLPEVLTGGTGLIGIRIPAHPLALELLTEFDGPITATSANLSGGKDPVTINDVHVRYDMLIDAGRLTGVPSTVVDLVEMRMIRPGERGEEAVAFLRGIRCE
jgi:L-threonylcarbamoyladenylate synthase